MTTTGLWNPASELGGECPQAARSPLLRPLRGLRLDLVSNRFRALAVGSKVDGLAGLNSRPKEIGQMTDRTTKVLLLAIAGGIWAHLGWES